MTHSLPAVPPVTAKADDVPPPPASSATPITSHEGIAS